MIVAAGAFAASLAHSLPSAITAWCAVLGARAALFLVSGR